MAEITCPNCGANYNVPEAALGKDGRQVSCANCGHTWHAMPPAPDPLILSQELQSTPRAAPPSPPQPAPQPTPQPVRAAPPPVQPASAQDAAERIREDRAKQLAEIRQIVDEVQNTPDPVDTQLAEPPRPEPAPSPTAGLAAALGMARDKSAVQEAVPTPPPVAPSPPQPEPGPVAPVYSAPVERDPLREKIEPKGKAPDTEKSRKSLMRKHNRRAKRKITRDKRGNGLFLTGFLLVVILVAILTAIYVLAPQITASAPGTTEAVNEYVARVDELRVAVAQGVSAIRDQVVEILGLAETG